MCVIDLWVPYDFIWIFGFIFLSHFLRSIYTAQTKRESEKFLNFFVFLDQYIFLRCVHDRHEVLFLKIVT